VARRATTRRTSGALPSRDEILAFIAANPGKAGKREIARAFGITGAARIGLKTMLKDLAREGLVEGNRRDLKRPGDLPPVTVIEVTGRDEDGELMAVPQAWPEERGDPPAIRLTVKRGARGAAVPGVGDRVLARLSAAPVPDEPYGASVIKVLSRTPRTVLGIARRLPSGWRLESVDRKQKDMLIDLGDKRIEDGDLVTVVASGERGHGLRRGRVEDVIGSMKNEKAVSLIALLHHGIPYEFPDSALAEAARAKEANLRGRDDWRELPLVTIDPEDAKDHDDAVHAAPDDDKENPGGFVVTVAIADVAHYVRPGTALDRAALERGNSVYFPDRVVPMLPERISNDLCSLKEGEDRPAMAVRLVFGADGRKRGHRFHRIMMRSAASLSYKRAQIIFDDPSSADDEKIAGPLRDLYRAYQAVAKARDDRGPLELDLPERKVVLDGKGHVERIEIPPRLAAHRLIEEFMIQANVAAAETLEAKRSPLVYRIHDTPSMAKMEALRDFLKSIELTFPHGGNLRPTQFNRVLERTRDSEHAQLISDVILRSQSQAEYSPDNIGHFGLNLRRYAHFTSPIRRYADLIVHRALVSALDAGSDGLPPDASDRLPEIAAQISVAERRAMKAERDTIDRLMAHWLADRVGATFAGRISGVTRAGLFVRLNESGADGFVPMSSLGDDYLVYDEGRHVLIGERGGTMHRLSDAAEVKLVEAIPVTGGLKFELLSEGTRVPPRDRPKRAPRRAARARPYRGRRRG